MASQGYSKILLMIDQATCHKKLTESYGLFEKGIHVLYIPGRMTGFIQPADVGWFDNNFFYIFKIYNIIKTLDVIFKINRSYQ